MSRDEEILHHTAIAQVLVDDAIERRGIAGSVPCAFGIDDRDRPVFTDLKAMNFRPEYSPVPSETELFQTTFEVLPSYERSLAVAALRLRLIAAEKDVTANTGHTCLFGDLGSSAPSGVFPTCAHDGNPRVEHPEARIGKAFGSFGSSSRNRLPDGLRDVAARRATAISSDASKAENLTPHDRQRNREESELRDIGIARRSEPVRTATVARKAERQAPWRGASTRRSRGADHRG
jgi:hypothetical protein